MKRIIILFLAIVSWTIFSCQPEKLVKIPILHLPNGDTIKISNQLKKSYTFCRNTKIYLGADSRLLIDSLDIATPFYIDTAKGGIYGKRDEEMFYVGKYFKDDVWRKGYVRMDNLSSVFYLNPRDTTQLFLLGYEPIDTNHNYICELRAFQNTKPKNSFRFNWSNDFFEEDGSLNPIDIISNDKELFLNVNFQWGGCGFTSDNFMLRYTDKFDSLLYYSSFGEELNDQGELVYVQSKNDGKLYAVYDGETMTENYDGDISKFMNSGILIIKRTYHETFANLLTNKNDFSIKEFIDYDLVYELQNNRLILLDSINYDSTKFRVYVPKWAEDVGNSN